MASSSRNTAPTPSREWFTKIWAETFRLDCGVHKKEWKNFFCLSCCVSFCSSCSHPGHPFVQVRKCHGRDAVNRSELEKYTECGDVVENQLNENQVIFINPNEKSKADVTPRSCDTCKRNIGWPYIFCCLSCKVDYVGIDDMMISLAELCEREGKNDKEARKARKAREAREQESKATLK